MVALSNFFILSFLAFNNVNAFPTSAPAAAAAVSESTPNNGDDVGLGKRWDAQVKCKDTHRAQVSRCLGMHLSKNKTTYFITSVLTCPNTVARR